jgi:hypothetical protein
MNTIDQVREFITKNLSVKEIKERITRINPAYNPHWIEEEWVRQQFKAGKTIIEVSLNINLDRTSFLSWTAKKIERYFNKVNHIAPAITASTIRRIATGQKSFDEARTFGVEFEFNRPITLTWNHIIDLLAKVKIKAKTVQRTDYADTSCWRLTNDGSVEVPFELIHTHQGGNEIKSGILRGSEGLEEVKKVLKVLRDSGCVINNSCGVHIHHGFKNKDDAENAKIIHNACLLYYNFKNKINKILPLDRRHNKYCRHFRPAEIEHLSQEYSKEPELRNQYGKKYAFHLDFCSDRNRAVNICAYFTHETLEFRQHSGTLDDNKTINWILFTQAFMTTAEDYYQRKINLLAHNYGPLSRELGLDPEVTNYITSRSEALKQNPVETEYAGFVQLTRGFRRLGRRRWR